MSPAPAALRLARRDAGLPIAVEEIEAAYAEMARLASAHKPLVREGEKAPLATDGLPGNVADLLENGDVPIRLSYRSRRGRSSDAAPLKHASSL